LNSKENLNETPWSMSDRATPPRPMPGKTKLI